MVEISTRCAPPSAVNSVNIGPFELMDAAGVSWCVEQMQAAGLEIAPAITKLLEAAKASGCHPLQDAFDRWDAAQCGFCTPGILMSAEALLRKRERAVSRDEVREALAGNLCRCTGYTKIIDAVVDASEQMFAADHDDAEQRQTGT